MSYGRVAARHMIVTVQASGRLAERAAHDEPHDHFDAFAARFPQIFDVRNVAELITVADQAVEEHIVPLRIDEARARSLQLVTHAAGTPDLDIQILGKAFDRLLDRFTQRPAAVA